MEIPSPSGGVLVDLDVAALLEPRRRPENELKVLSKVDSSETPFGLW